MSMVKTLFNTASAHEATDGLQQEEREALIDFLLFCEFADNHLSLAEDKILQEEIGRFSWDAVIDIDIYISSAAGRARQAKVNVKTEESFLKNAASRLQSSHAKTVAKTLMAKLFRSDGEADAEKALAETVLPYLQ